MITDEPLDELFVRLSPDDYFMNLHGDKRRQFEFEKVKANPKVKPRYRREREYCASKGRLREVMQLNFAFMEDFYKATKKTCLPTSVLASPRHASDARKSPSMTMIALCAARRSSSRTRIISTQSPGLLLTKPIDTLFMRVSRKDANFNLSTFKS